MPRAASSPSFKAGTLTASWPCAEEHERACQAFLRAGGDGLLPVHRALVLELIEVNHLAGDEANARLSEIRARLVLLHQCRATTAGYFAVSSEAGIASYAG